MEPIAAPVPGGLGVTAAEVAAAGSKWPLAMAIGMLYLGALPNGLVTPLLSELFVERYGTSVAASHWFMAVNLIGAVAVLPLLARLRKSMPPSVLLAGAAVFSGALFALMAMPIGFAWTLSLRILEGAADLVLLAIIFDLLSKAGAARRRGARFGAAGTILMLGIATGFIGGGAIGQHDAVMALVVGSLACFAIATFALLRHAHFDGLVRSCPLVSDTGAIDSRNTASPLWPALIMTAGDRALAGLASTTLLFYFALAVHFEPQVRGMLLGGTLLLTALGSWPAGCLADRFGHLRVRAASSTVYCVSLASIPLLAPLGVAPLALAMLCFGIAGAGLMPTSIVLASRSGRGSLAMGAYHASGNLGYHLLGVGAAATLLAILGHGAPDQATYHAIIWIFAFAYGSLSALTIFALRSPRNN